MRLAEIDVRRFRSIRNQSDDESLEFEGLDCLVGKNNAGKTNILSAVKFLLDEDEKDLDDELFWQKNTDEIVDVRGFFELNEDDLNRIDDPEKLEKVEESLLSEGKHENRIGICRQVENVGESPDIKRLDFRPDDERLSVDHLEEYRKSRWEDQKDPDKGYSKDDYERDMKDEFPEIANLIDSRHDQKKVWKDKLEEYIESRPDSVDFSLQPTGFKQGTKKLILNRLLPQVISIPAIREVESTTKRGGEFGNLLKQISSEIQDELDQQLQEELDGFQPRNHESIERVENWVSDHLSSTFEEQTVQIDFPDFSSDYLFKNADISIDENYIEDLSKENVGEGVKRTVVFSLLRTLADLRAGRLILSEDAEPTENPRPLLILYEEAELFLHPSLQKTLLNTLSQLSDAESQIIFTTHSPFMIQYEILDTINIIRKEGERGTTVTEFHNVLDQQNQTDQSRLTDLQSVSSYIFSDKVVLVEGLSDKIVFKKLASRINSEWDFDKKSIPILNAGGKGDVCRFKRFLEELGIDTFAIFDIDAAKGECETVVSSEDALEALDTLRDAVESEFSGPRYSGDDLGIVMRTMQWQDAFEKLDDLKTRLEEGGKTDDEDIELLTKILAKSETTTPPNSLWAAESVREERIIVMEELLEENILLLSGELEEYYPYDGGGKREQALKFDPSEYDVETLRGRFTSLESINNTDVEEFLSRVFPTPAK
jgi:predicted ATP-dependent endonuclease of OLD family